MEIIDWLMANADTIAQVAAYVIAISAVLAKITPTRTDNRAVYAVLHLLDMLGLNNDITRMVRDEWLGDNGPYRNN